MSYRNQSDLRRAFGAATRGLRALLSWRRLDLDESDGDRVTALGRQSADGGVETDVMEQCAPVGLIGRPADDATVEAVVGFVGADGDHPVSVATLDHTRRAVISQVGLEPDTTLVYTSEVVAKLGAGVAEVRSLAGSAESLAYLASINARIDAIESQLQTLIVALNTHTHVVISIGNPTSNAAASTPPVTFVYANTSPADGTSVLLGE